LPRSSPTYALKASENTALQTKSNSHASDVGFFDPQLDPSYGPGDVAQVGRDLYSRDVYLFVEKVKDAVIMSGADAVRAGLFACPRGSAQVWYPESLIDLEKEALRTIDDETDH
jgi:hypothetical protein